MQYAKRVDTTNARRNRRWCVAIGVIVLISTASGLAVLYIAQLKSSPAAPQPAAQPTSQAPRHIDAKDLPQYQSDAWARDAEAADAMHATEQQEQR